MTAPYDPAAWFWIVAGDRTQWYSSAAGTYVPPDSAAAVAFLAAGNIPTKIASEDELWDVLAEAGQANTATLRQRIAELIADDPLQGRLIETVIRALKAANPAMNIPTRAQIIQAWKDSE